MMQKVYDDETMSRTRNNEYYRRFKDGRMSMEDDPSSAWNSASTDDESIERVRAVIRSD